MFIPLKLILIGFDPSPNEYKKTEERGRITSEEWDIIGTQQWNHEWASWTTRVAWCCLSWQKKGSPSLRKGSIFRRLPSGYVKIAIENGPVEIVDLPMIFMVDLSIYRDFPLKMVIFHRFHGGSFQFANRKRLPGRVSDGRTIYGTTPPWTQGRCCVSSTNIGACELFMYVYIYIYVWYIYIYVYHTYIYIYHTTVISYKLLSIHQYGWLTINYWSLLSIDYFDHLSLGLAALKGTKNEQNTQFWLK